MEIKKCFDSYLENVKATTSIENFQFNFMNTVVLNHFFSFCNVKNTKEININLIYKLIEFLKKRKNCGNSINKKIGTLRRALKFSSIKIEGVSDFKKIRFPAKHYEIIPEESLKKILLYLHHLSKSPVNLTKYLVFMLLLCTGARAKELIQIKVRNIDMDLNMILLEETKAKNPRYVFYDPSLNQDLKEYISLKDREYLFYNFRPNVNKRFTPGHLRELFKYLKKHLEIPVLHAHMVRHTMATILVENDAPLTTIKELLGHQSLTTTQIYLHMSMKKVKLDYEKHFPKM